MSRFIAVIHGWFVDSNGFSVLEIEAHDKQEANEKACYLNEKSNSTFNKCAYIVLEIGPEETLKGTRKLTWRERITGRSHQ